MLYYIVHKSDPYLVILTNWLHLIIKPLKHASTVYKSEQPLNNVYLVVSPSRSSLVLRFRFFSSVTKSLGNRKKDTVGINLKYVADNIYLPRFGLKYYFPKRTYKMHGSLGHICKELFYHKFHND